MSRAPLVRAVLALSALGLSLSATPRAIRALLRRSWPRVGPTVSSRLRSAPPGRPSCDAVLQTAPRTLNTGIGAMFNLTALTLLGGSSLTDFALALLLGLVVGTYSSAFTAAPLAPLLEQRVDAPPPMPKRPPAPTRSGRTRESGAVV